jgi:hypothetical protein
MSEHNIHPTRPPAWLAIGATSHYRAPHAVTLCGASIPPNAITGKGLPRCKACASMRHNKPRRSVNRLSAHANMRAIEAKPVRKCSWCERVSPTGDHEKCKKQRANWIACEGVPPDALSRRGNDRHEWSAGRGAGYGEPFRVPNSEMRRAPVGIY